MVSAKPFSQSFTMSFVSWSLLRPWPAKSCWGGKTSDYALVQGQDCINNAQKFPTWTVRVMHLHRWWCAVKHCPAFFYKPTPFLHSPFVLCTFTNVPVNFYWMNIYCLKILSVTGHRWQHFRLLFSPCNDYSKWKRKLQHCTMQYTFHLTYRWLTFEESVHITCTAAVYNGFLLSQRAL